jgi:hypothetical protein
VDPTRKCDSAVGEKPAAQAGQARQRQRLAINSYHYQMYGVAIRSDFETLHPRVSRPRKPRIIISRSQSPLYYGARRNSSTWFTQKTLGDGSVYLHWAGLFEFLISADGVSIAARELGRASSEAFATYLLGQVLSFALVMQGLDSLHATAISIGTSSIGFIGDCGAGKSTLLASFLQSGYKLLTDDLLLLSQVDDCILSYPGPQRIKLLPETAMLLPRRNGSVRMNPLVRKLVFPIDAKQCCARPVPLKALYLLGKPASTHRISISTLAPQKVLLALIKNSFNVALTDTKRLERQFNWAANIAAKVPVKRVSYPRDLAALPKVRAAILADLS